MFERISSSLSPQNAIAAFAGGALPHTILSCCQGTLLSMFCTPAVLPLRATCTDAMRATAAHPWADFDTVIQGRIAAWRACFPCARSANVRMYAYGGGAARNAPVVDADFVHLEGLWELNICSCTGITDAAFAHLRGIRTLDMTLCRQGAITDAAFAHLAGVQRLSLWDCQPFAGQPFILTDAAFAHLRGIRVLNMSWCKQFTDAAFAHLRGIHALFMWNCNQRTLTDAALAHLAGIHTLVMEDCTQDFTAAGLAHLRGVQRLSLADAAPATVAAAQALGLPVTTHRISGKRAFAPVLAGEGGGEWRA